MEYKALEQQIFSNGNFRIVPIRMEDRFVIKKWRNEQIFHLRQSKPLTDEEQDTYFNTVVKSLFSQETPSQLLFSYMEGESCIGYGGLVHMNWVDKNAEISFITETSISQTTYGFHLSTFLELIGEVAASELKFHKIFTYAFDVRPEIYPVLEASGFHQEAVLKEHCFFDGRFIDVLIHSKIL